MGKADEAQTFAEERHPVPISRIRERPNPAMHDYYRNFSSLLADERADVDYRICSWARQSPVLVMAPHGGGIEPGTSEIVRQTAGEDYSLFMFEGIKSSGNRQLHVKSENYELPQALIMAQRADWLIAVHGCEDEDDLTLVGGLDFGLKWHITEELATNRFPVSTSPRPGLGGIAPKNICNRNHRNAGVQIEISRGQRRRMFKDLGRRGRGEATVVFYRFCESLRSAIFNALHSI